MEMEVAKNMRFLGQIKEILIFDGGMGKWFLAVKTPGQDEYLKLRTASGSLRLFNSLGSANKVAVELLRVQPSPLLDIELQAVPHVRIIN